MKSCRVQSDSCQSLDQYQMVVVYLGGVTPLTSCDSSHRSHITPLGGVMSTSGALGPLPWAHVLPYMARMSWACILPGFIWFWDICIQWNECRIPYTSKWNKNKRCGYIVSWLPPDWQSPFSARSVPLRQIMTRLMCMWPSRALLIQLLSVTLRWTNSRTFLQSPDIGIQLCNIILCYSMLKFGGNPLALDVWTDQWVFQWFGDARSVYIRLCAFVKRAVTAARPQECNQNDYKMLFKHAPKFCDIAVFCMS